MTFLEKLWKPFKDRASEPIQRMRLPVQILKFFSVNYYSGPLNNTRISGADHLHCGKSLYNLKWPSTYIESQPWIKNVVDCRTTWVWTAPVHLHVLLELKHTCNKRHTRAGSASALTFFLPVMYMPCDPQ